MTHEQFKKAKEFEAEKEIVIEIMQMVQAHLLHREKLASPKYKPFTMRVCSAFNLAIIQIGIELQGNCEKEFDNL